MTFKLWHPTEQEQLPSIEDIQKGLIGPQVPDSFAAFIISFVKLCIEDPGFPNSREVMGEDEIIRFCLLWVMGFFTG